MVRVTLKTCCFPFLLTCSMHLLLSDGVTPHLWQKVKITPLHKKGPITSPQNYRLLTINGCIYRLFANVVRDLLINWALAEHQIPDSQFGFCPTRNTNQPLFILRHILATAKRKNEGVHCFSGPPCCLRQYSKRETLATFAKKNSHNIWEISSKPCTQDASTFLLMATKFPGRLRLTKA